MALTLAVAACFVFFLGWVALPLLPSLLEVRRRTDVRPLRVVRASDVDVRHFARAFGTWVEGHLGAALAACRAGEGPVEGELEDGTPYVVLADGDTPSLALPLGGPAACPTVTVGSGALELPPRALFPLEVYAGGSVEVGEQSVCRAVLAGGDLRLGRACWSLRWLHARASLLADEACALHGRASADGAMRLATGCRFERLHAPDIAFGAPLAPVPRAPESRAAYTSRDVPGMVEDSAGRWLVRRRLDLPPRRLVTSDLVVTGGLTVGAGTRIVGSVKSHGDVGLEAGVEIEGSVVAWGNVRVGPGCRVRGPVIAEGDARVAAGAELGTRSRPTTLSVRRLEIEAGSLVHGTVWAHAGGVVLPAPTSATTGRGR